MMDCEHSTSTPLDIMNVYKQIRGDCAITTAACDKYAPYLLAMLASLDNNFVQHPIVYIYDLGMQQRQIDELNSISWVKLIKPQHFAPHWRECYSWKPYLLSLPTERYRMQIDAGCIILRPLDALFVVINKSGYLLFDQGQTLDQVTYPQLWDRVGLNALEFGKERVFAAGIFGFDSQSSMGIAVQEATLLSKEGWALGYSESEKHRVKMPNESIVRNCNVFRHDQTLINLTARNQYSELSILAEKHIPCRNKYNNKAYIWNCRKNFPKSLIWFYVPCSRITVSFLINRILELKVFIKISSIIILFIFRKIQSLKCLICRPLSHAYKYR